MANIGATTAFYKVETSLTRANNEVSKSMERLATGKANANAGDRSSYVAMADTFRLDFVGTKAGIKGASVVMGYLETGMRVLDSASALLSRLQELAVLGANDTNTDADALAINAEAEAIADEFHRLMSTSTYKGKDIFVDTANSEYVSMGGRNSEMNFGLGRVKYSNLYLHSYDQYYKDLGLTTQDSDDIASREIAAMAHLAGLGTDSSGVGATNRAVLVEGVAYELTTAFSDNDSGDGTGTEGQMLRDALKFASGIDVANDHDLFSGANAAASDASDGTVRDNIGTKFTATANGIIEGDGHFAKQVGQLVISASEGMLHTNPDTDMLTARIEDVQAKINTARVQAGSQYAALESAVNYTTDLTAQYELGYNTVNDVNFSMETAHLAKNQILQQAATAMLAQANQGQQGLLQLIS
jgi:flagellin